MKFNFMSAVLLVFVTSAAHAQPAKLTPIQRQAVAESVQIMRRLVSAIEIGPTYGQYGSLLIDAKIAVEERLAKIPEGPAYFFVSRALGAFIDAHELWRMALSADSAQHYILNGCPIFEKYQVQIDQLSNCRNVDAIFQVIPAGAEMYHAGWRRRLLEPPLGQIWQTGAEYLVKAQGQL